MNLHTLPHVTPKKSDTEEGEVGPSFSPGRSEPRGVIDRNSEQYEKIEFPHE